MSADSNGRVTSKNSIKQSGSKRVKKCKFALEEQNREASPGLAQQLRDCAIPDQPSELRMI